MGGRDPRTDPQPGDRLVKPDHKGVSRLRVVVSRAGDTMQYRFWSGAIITCVVRRWVEWAQDAEVPQEVPDDGHSRTGGG